MDAGIVVTFYTFIPLLNFIEKFPQISLSVMEFLISVFPQK